jgi:DNA (cytosine-5)-methyltransferase 1
MSRFRFVDLFSGAGGLSYGFKAHRNFAALLAVDAQVGKPSSGEHSLECNKTYERNIGIAVHEANLRCLEPKALLTLTGLRPGQLEVLLACAPCTGFSRTLRKNHVEDDPRNHLVQRVGHFVAALRPAILIMENARELLHGNFSHHSDRLIEHLTSLGYAVRAEVHMLSDFGLPQIRERALILAVRDGGPALSLRDLWRGYDASPQSTTVRHAISALPPVRAGETHPTDPMHVSPRFQSPETIARLQALPRDGGSWFDLLNHPDADRLLIPSMKRSATRGDFGSHPDVYGRLWWDRPCVTIKRECAHVGNGRYSHPEQDRQCTLREMALLNGFPSDYVFEGTSLSNKYRHVGDAVPPLISFQLAHLAHWTLTGKRPDLAECILPGTSFRSNDIVRHLPTSLLDLADDGQEPASSARVVMSSAKSCRDGARFSTTAETLNAPVRNPS